ncbi:hypothetical protein D9Q98_006464 [Chlorella vulgaris]|uniref:Nucleotide-diphospho-sugar transferase domain-containing protein n=1 Tax=Chlorella vulgaris TaxID=3077 RepID=A0A9D4TKE5_CHLVU|nr:hypothetical protein D9Q98_006464 [Chlorella vulgaris]
MGRRRSGGGALPMGAAAGHAYSMPMASPSRSMYYAMQANPKLLKSDQGFLEEFEAAPWLLPPRTPLLPYADTHDFDGLLKLRSRPAGGQTQTITVLLFSKAYAALAQNSIYSLVKHGGVRNYVALTWFKEDFEACLDLNLPCADVSDMLVEPLITNTKLLQHDFIVMSWIKPAVVLRALHKGYAVMSADTDVAYTVKPVWESYLELIHRNDADGAWQAEAPLNSGHFVLLPTAPAIRFAKAWSGSAAQNVKAMVAEQKALPDLEGSHFVTCRTPCMCYKHKLQLMEQNKREQVAVFAAFYPGFFMYTQSGCTVGSEEWVPDIDPCDWSVLFLHPICVGGASTKESIMRRSGFWFVDSEGCAPHPDSASQVPACHPLHWRQPQVEVPHYACQTFDLALVHGKMPFAVAALQAGLAGDDAWRLLLASRDKDCWPDDPKLLARLSPDAAAEQSRTEPPKAA